MADRAEARTELLERIADVVAPLVLKGQEGKRLRYATWQGMR